MSGQSVTTKKPDFPVINWCGLSEVQAIIELCTRLNIRLSVTSDGRLSAQGNTGTTDKYFADIARRYRGIVIARLLDLPVPEVTDQQDSLNIAANCQALDATITEYCAAVGHPEEYLEKLLTLRRKMAPSVLVQNLCAFRAWLYAANLKAAMTEYRNRKAEHDRTPGPGEGGANLRNFGGG